MKVFNGISWVVFLIGILMKFLHFPTSGLVLMFGCLLILIHSIIHVALKLKEKRVEAFIHLVFALWVIYLLIRLQFWPGGPELFFGVRPVFLVPFMATVAFLIAYFLAGKRINLRLIVLLVFSVSLWIFSYVPSYQVYYAFNLNTLFYSESRDFNYYAWDKYSWFLYLRGEKEQALEANKKAQAARLTFFTPESQFGDRQMEELERRQVLIQLGIWESWYPVY